VRLIDKPEYNYQWTRPGNWTQVTQNRNTAVYALPSAPLYGGVSVRVSNGNCSTGDGVTAIRSHAVHPVRHQMNPELKVQKFLLYPIREIVRWRLPYQTDQKQLDRFLFIQHLV
jgi:hypothetical protein